MFIAGFYLNPVSILEKGSKFYANPVKSFWPYLSSRAVVLPTHCLVAFRSVEGYRSTDLGFGKIGPTWMWLGMGD